MAVWKRTVYRTRSKDGKQLTQPACILASTADSIICSAPQIVSGYSSLASVSLTKQQELALAAPALHDPLFGGNPDNGSLIASKESCGLGGTGISLVTHPLNPVETP